MHFFTCLTFLENLNTFGFSLDNLPQISHHTVLHTILEYFIHFIELLTRGSIATTQNRIIGILNTIAFKGLAQPAFDSPFNIEPNHVGIDLKVPKLLKQLLEGSQ